MTEIHVEAAGDVVRLVVGAASAAGPLVDPHPTGDIRNVHRSIADMIDATNPPKLGDVLRASTGDIYRDWVGVQSAPGTVVEIVGRFSHGASTSGWIVLLQFGVFVSRQECLDGFWLRVASGVGQSDIGEEVLFCIDETAADMIGPANAPRAGDLLHLSSRRGASVLVWGAPLVVLSVLGRCKHSDAWRVMVRYPASEDRQWQEPIADDEHYVRVACGLDG